MRINDIHLGRAVNLASSVILLGRLIGNMKLHRSVIIFSYLVAFSVSETAVKFFKCNIYLFFFHFEHHKPSAIWLHYIQEKADSSTADLAKTQQLTTKQSRWINSTTVTFLLKDHKIILTLLFPSNYSNIIYPWGQFDPSNLSIQKTVIIKVVTQVYTSGTLWVFVNYLENILN